MRKTGTIDRFLTVSPRIHSLRRPPRRQLTTLLDDALLVTTMAGGASSRRGVLLGRTNRSGGRTAEHGLQVGILRVSRGRGAQVLGKTIRGLKIAELLPRQKPPLSSSQTVDGNRGERGTGEPDHGEPRFVPHPPNLLVPPLTQDQLEPRVPGLPLGHDDLRGKRDTVLEHHPVPPLRDVFGRHVSLHLHEVGFGDMVTRVEHPRREVAVVGQQQGATRLVVETANRVEA